jgi:hypothetical protein
MRRDTSSILRAAATLLSTLSLLLMSADCRRDSSAAHEHSNDSVPLPTVAASAFDLVADDAGLTLVFAPAARSRGALLALAIDGDGVAHGEPEPILAEDAIAGAIDALVALRVQGALLVVFVERSAKGAELKAVSRRGAALSAPLTIGHAPSNATPSFGDLALASDGSEAMLFARGDAAPCASDPAASCAGFRLYRLRDGKPEGAGLPLAVPSPCGGAALVLALTPSRWRYGVCNQESGQTTTTLFTIEREPNYASAEALLPGCTPLALTVWPELTLLVGDCAGRRSAVNVTRGTTAAAPEAIAAPKTSCHGGVTRVALDGGKLELSAPKAGLDALLPETIANRGSRAAWAGRALVVATKTGDRLTLTRHACSAGIFSADRVRGD